MKTTTITFASVTVRPPREGAHRAPCYLLKPASDAAETHPIKKLKTTSRP